MTRNLAERPPRSIFFGPFVLVPERQLLMRGDAPVRIGGRALDILAALLERPGELVTKRELMARAWPNMIVDEGNLKVNIAALRRALGADPGAAQYIATVVGRGYRFVAPVQLSEPSGLSLDTAMAPTRNHNLPAVPTRIVGRADAIDTMRREFDGVRMVSIVGAGGIGKTTVAIAVGEHLIGQLRDGVWLIDLSSLKDPALLPSAIATAIGLAAHSADMLTALSGFLRDREMLLILDNCEHIIEAVASCADHILQVTAGVKLLATSREPLRVKGERVRRLPGLGIPLVSSDLTAAGALAFPAIQLFVDRATDRLELFSLSDTDAPVVAEICRRLDGLALAIELAATRVDAFGVVGLLNQLELRPRDLEGWRTGPERQRTLTATIDWSFNLLCARDQIVFRRLSVFAGAFTMEAAVAVAAWGEYCDSDVVESLCDLVDQSLVTSDVSRSETFFRLLETTRAYARQKLVAESEAEPMSRRHAEYCQRSLVEAEAALARDCTAGWSPKVGWIIDDVRAALNWAFSLRGDNGLAVSLTLAALPLWFQQSLINECTERIDQALSTLDLAAQKHDRTAVMLHTARACVLSATPGKSQETKLAWTSAYELAERLGDTDYLLRNLWGLWAGKMIEADFQSARSIADRFCALAPKSSDPSDSAVGHRLLAAALHFLGDQYGALHHVEQMLDGYRSSSRRAHVIRYQFDQLVTAGIAQSRSLWVLGRGEEALKVLDSSIEDAIANGHTLSLCNTLMQAACPVALLAGDLVRAERFTDLLRKESERSSLGVWHLFVGCFQGQILVKRGDVLEGLSLIRAAIDRQHYAGHQQYYASFNLAYAEALAAAGSPAEAMAAVDTALAHAARNNEHWATAEMFRVKGEITALAGDELSVASADGHFRNALELAIQQGALAWQLRAATSLARLRHRQGRASEGTGLLAAVYGVFTEGHGLHDLVAARRLLDELE